MAPLTFPADLVEEIEKLKQRVTEQTTHVERCTGDDMIEEQAVLRNLDMQLEGLKLKLRSQVLLRNFLPGVCRTA